jgi:hypothetical protein
MNAIFALYYTGVAGSGFGLVMLREGTIVGADAAGGIYDGRYSLEDDGRRVAGKVQLQVPPDTGLVTGAASGPAPALLEIPLSLPADLGGGKVVPVNTTTGPVNVIFRKLRDVQ